MKSRLRHLLAGGQFIFPGCFSTYGWLVQRPVSFAHLHNSSHTQDYPNKKGRHLPKVWKIKTQIRKIRKIKHFEANKITMKTIRTKSTRMVSNTNNKNIYYLVCHGLWPPATPSHQVLTSYVENFCNTSFDKKNDALLF
jgi:hypothetical protein